jgi:hypothetical protein
MARLMARLMGVDLAAGFSVCLGLGCFAVAGLLNPLFSLTTFNSRL